MKARKEERRPAVAPEQFNRRDKPSSLVALAVYFFFSSIVISNTMIKIKAS
jgi:hypothetical protein